MTRSRSFARCARRSTDAEARSPTPQIDTVRRRSYVPAVSSRESITLRGLQFHTLIGVLPHESTLPQPLEVDVTVSRSSDIAQGSSVLDYRALYDLVAEVAGRPSHYLEEVGRRIADAALELEGVQSVRVAARKPHVALPGPLAYAEIVIEREQRD